MSHIISPPKNPSPRKFILSLGNGEEALKGNLIFEGEKNALYPVGKRLPILENKINPFLRVSQALSKMGYKKHPASREKNIKYPFYEGIKHELLIPPPS
jgi:hypothetical protein